MTPTAAQWTRLYKDLSLLAHRMTFTKDPARQWTARDRAQEAVQKACLRYLELRPAGLDTYEAVWHYLAGALRSALGHAVERAVTRAETERAAVVEEATVTGGAMASPEAMNLEAGQRVADHTRAARKLRMLRLKLEAANDTLARATMKCIEEGVTAPQDQARILECSIDDVYNARKRRKRAMDEVEAEYSDEDSGEENQ